jgi:hypothetical protein
MTDFLTSLVERSFGTVAAIRPRVASLFEPVRKHGAPSVDVAEPREGEFFREERPQPDSRKKTVEHPALALRDSVGRSLDVARIANGVPAPFAVPLPRDASDARSPSAPSPRSLVAESVLPTPGLEHRHEAAPREPYQRDRDWASTSPAAPSELNAGAVGDDAATRSVAFVASSRTVENDERGLLVPPKISAEIAAEMQNAVSAWGTKPGKRLNNAMERSTADMGAQPEPNVHVTIGRIDVRATTEGNAPARQRPASPVMSLDEYLRLQVQRGGR